jgi:hypothetical protein
VTATVRNTDMGSLIPDSTSSTASTDLARRVFWLRMTRKTAAASVDATMLPSNTPSRNDQPSPHVANAAVTSAVSTTPSVARLAAGRMARASARGLVWSPPAKRMTANATRPTSRVSA